MAPVVDASAFVDYLLRRVASFRGDADGVYRNEAGDDPSRADEYGVAGAAGVLYTAGAFPAWDERTAWVERILELQDPETGAFRHRTHTAFHTTAHLLGALELFDARPAHPLRFLDGMRDRAGLEAFLDGLRWSDDPWFSSWSGAGLASALTIDGSVGPEWFDAYFAWLDAQSDPETGLWRRGSILPVDGPTTTPRTSAKPDIAPSHGRYANLAGAFHYLFVYEHHRRPFPHVDALIDSCLELFEREPFPIVRDFMTYSDLDWIYVIGRASRQSPHRRDEVDAALRALLPRVDLLISQRETDLDRTLVTAHSLLGAISVLAELQQLLPGAIRTDRPLRLVLDRRPFI